MKKVIGVHESQGNFEGTDYHNINFHCSEAFDKDKCEGTKTSIVKVKYDVLCECVGKALMFKEIVSLIGRDVAFYYDEHGKVNVVQFAEKQTATQNGATQKA